MKYCVRCHKQAWTICADDPLCLSCFDEQFTRDLGEHAKVCECRACEEFGPEYDAWLDMVAAGLADAETQPPVNKYAGVTL